MSSLFIPGRGSMDIRALKVENAVRAYDERLMFAKNEETGDWCVFIRMPRPEQPYPVCGFGREIPEVEDVMFRIRRADTMRNGEAVYRDVVKSQEKYRAELKYKGDQATDESVEVVEHFMRKHGKSPIIKSFSKGVSNDAG
jgi:hypothetical protein